MIAVKQIPCNIAHSVDMERFKAFCCTCAYSPKVRDRLMRPPLILESLLIKLCNTHFVLVVWDMLRHNIHSGLAQKHIRANSCRSRDACCVKHILYQHTGKTVTVRVVGTEIASLLLAHDVPMKAIQEWLGHSNFSIMANLYSHLEYNDKVSSAETIARVLEGSK